MEKKCFTIAVMGHGESGKTTVVGHILYNWRVWDKRTLEDFDKFSKQVGFLERKYFLFCGKVNPLKEANSTRCLRKWRYSSDNFQGVIIDVYCDTKKYIDELSSGKSQCVLICVSAVDFENEERIDECHEQLVVAGGLGIPVIVGVNKMDLTTPPYSEEKFSHVVKNMKSHLQKCGFEDGLFICVPFSAMNGDNFLAPSSNMTWFKGWNASHEGKNFSGMSLLDAFEHLSIFTAPSEGEEEESGTDQETNAPPAKKPRLVDMKEYLDRGMSFLESAMDSNDFVADVSTILNKGVILCGSKGVGQRVVRFIRDGTERIKVFDLYADGLTIKMLEKHIEEASLSAPSILLLKSVEKAAKELAPVLLKPGTGGKLVFVLATTSKLDLIDPSVRAAFEVVELKE